MQVPELLPSLFRSEYAKMTAVLCRHFGLAHIETAEDMVSEAFLKASEAWPLNGIPENPAGWLYTVAKNKTKDRLKRLALFEKKMKNGIETEQNWIEEDFDFTAENISDSQLAMIFAVCNTENRSDAQICLALQVLCGFSLQEIADAFLSNVETIKKRLFRAKQKLRTSNFQLVPLPQAAIQAKLDAVLRTLYLLFNEGYFSRSNNQLIRKELCAEAMRLVLFLTANPLTNTTNTNALLALMCFQSSRFDARLDQFGEIVLFDAQNKELWDQNLIDKGNCYLVNACSGSELSGYHLQAAIAYWHTTTDDGKWPHILSLYNELILMEYSPVTALNRTFAFAKVYGKEPALYEAKKLGLGELSHYHALLGFLNEEIDQERAISCYQNAISLSKSKIERHTLAKAIAKLSKIA